MTGATKDSRELPTLADHIWLRLFAFALLYCAQGLPWGLFTVAIPAWLAGQGFGVGEIGAFIAVSSLPWSFKLLAGPLMDRYAFPSMGRRRPWVIGAQAGILIALIALALAPDPADQLMSVAAIGFFVNTFCATQDVAVDGMAIDILPERERGRATAFMYGGQMAGISLAGALGTSVLNDYGLPAAALMLMGATGLIMLVPVLLRERPGERMFPWSAGHASPGRPTAKSNFKRIFADLTRVLILPMSLLLVFTEFLNRAAAGIIGAVSPVFTVQVLGWSDTTFAQWVATAGVSAAIFGVLVSPMVDRYGAQRVLIWTVAARCLMFFVTGLFGNDLGDGDIFIGVIFANSLSSQVVTVAIIALFMEMCAVKIAATQFAVYMASANLSLSIGSSLVAPLSDVLSITSLFHVVAGMNLLFLMVWPFFDIGSHRRQLASFVTPGAAGGA